MGGKKKVAIAIIDRSSKRYTFFDTHNLTHLEKVFYLQYALEDRYLESITNEEYDYPNSLTETIEFVKPINYNSFIDDVVALVEQCKPITEEGISIDENEIVANIHSFDWNVSKITNYLSNLMAKGNTVNSLMSFIHIQNFTETIIYYPYDRGKSIYQDHIRHLVEIDFKQSEDNVIKYVKKLHKALQVSVKRNKYETTTSSTTLMLDNRLNYGDFLYAHDCKALNYTQLDTANSINTFRELEQSILEKTTSKKINTYLKDLKKLGYECELLEVYTVPEISITYV